MSRLFDREIIDGFFDGGQENQRQVMLKRKLLKEFMDFNLTKTQKQYIMLYYKDKMTLKEIAQRFGVVPSTVSRTIKRARTRLYKALTGRELFSLYAKEVKKNEKENSD